MEPENPQLFTLRSETPEKESVPAQTEDQSRERVSDLEQIQKEDSSEEICTESERMRKETELIETSLKQLEARENELREVEAKRKFFDLKEKELEEKEKELELKQRQVQERSIQDGPSVDAEPLTQQRNHNDEDKEKDSASVLSASVQIKFNDFRKTMSSFMAGQVWALYDGIDSMPRCYGRIKKVNKCQSSLQVTWLEPKAEESVLAACGRFKWENTDTIQSHLAFSHEIHPIIRGKHFIAVNPSKGETWALFRDWSKSWNNDPEQHKTPYRYDFVEVLVSFDDSLGVGVAYLGKVQGFASVYKQAVQHGVISFMITPEEMQRFSHRVPSFSCTLEPDHSIRSEAEETENQSEDCGNTDEVEDRDGSRKEFPIVID
ncbi:hypothetical protein AXX17_AT3G04590 [Arabidopsis thaliana]|uniref:DUF3444 domain-containing protein n=1 Tax=Arabidopsis thaliana TaxID=3702 RepID=A0A178VJK2_ARATH|nr:hypothetical protein AXX17_AT3G04590 [Arabidopsis thaliana]